MHRTVLVAATAGEAAHDALALGVALARPFGAGVVLAGVAPLRGRRAEPPDTLLRELERLRETAPSDLPVSITTTASASVLRGLHDLALERGAQLLVLGPSHRGAVTRALHGDLAADVVFSAPCAVAVATRGQSTQPPRRVGVAWNETRESNEALEWGVQLAERTGGTVRVVRVLDPRHDDAEFALGVDERLQWVRRAAERRAATDAEVLWGNPADALTDVTRGLDLLVLGSRAQGPLRRAVLGSVSANVLHGAHCPVVVLPGGVYAPQDTAAV
jgi:nucleotide-binding universal stress UspA family protein